MKDDDDSEDSLDACKCQHATIAASVSHNAYRQVCVQSCEVHFITVHRLNQSWWVLVPLSLYIYIYMYIYIYIYIYMYVCVYIYIICIGPKVTMQWLPSIAFEAKVQSSMCGQVHGVCNGTMYLRSLTGQPALGLRARSTALKGLRV